MFDFTSGAILKKLSGKRTCGPLEIWLLWCFVCNAFVPWLPECLGKSKPPSHDWSSCRFYMKDPMQAPEILVRLPSRLLDCLTFKPTPRMQGVQSRMFRMTLQKYAMHRKEAHTPKVVIREGQIHLVVIQVPRVKGVSGLQYKISKWSFFDRASDAQKKLQEFLALDWSMGSACQPEWIETSLEPLGFRP